MPRNLRREHGFTLIELLVVVLIIGVLAAIAIPIFNNQRARGIEAQVKAQVDNVVKAVETALADATGPISGDHTTGAVSIDAHTVPVTTTDNIAWAVAGDTGEYCITSWSNQGGKYTPGHPLRYDSSVGRFLPDGVECGTEPEVPGPGDDEPEPEAPYADTLTREVRSINNSGVFYDIEVTKTPQDNGTTLVVLNAKWTNTEHGDAFIGASSANARWRCIDTDTGSLTAGSPSTPLRTGLGSTNLSGANTYSARTTCPVGAVPYDFTFSADTQHDPWWVSQEYLDVNGWPTPTPDPYADIVANLEVPTGVTTREMRSWGDQGVFTNMDFQVVETDKWRYTVRAYPLEWVRIDGQFGSTSGLTGLRCISPSGHLRPLGLNVLNSTNSSSVANTGPSYRINGSPSVHNSCPTGYLPYDFSTEHNSTDPVVDDPWWVSSKYVELNGTPPDVADPYVEALMSHSFADAEGIVVRPARSIDDLGVMEDIEFTVTQVDRWQYRLTATMKWTATEPGSVGSTSGRFALRCLMPSGRLVVVGQSITGGTGYARITTSGSYYFRNAQCPVGSVPYDISETHSTDPSPSTDPWWVSNVYLDAHGTPPDVSDPYLDALHAFDATTTLPVRTTVAPRVLPGTGTLGEFYVRSATLSGRVWTMSLSVPWTYQGGVYQVSGHQLKCRTLGGQIINGSGSMTGYYGYPRFTSSDTEVHLNNARCGTPGSTPYAYYPNQTMEDPWLITAIHPDF